MKCFWPTEDNNNYINYNDDINYKVCDGISNVGEHSSFDYMRWTYVRMIPSHMELCYSTLPEVVNIPMYARISAHDNNEKMPSDSLQVSEFSPYGQLLVNSSYDDSQTISQYSIQLTDKELIKIAFKVGVGHCETEVTSIERNDIHLPDDYKCIGRIIDKERLYNLFLNYDAETDKCNSGYCEGNTGIYYE